MGSYPAATLCITPNFAVVARVSGTWQHGQQAWEFADVWQYKQALGFGACAVCAAVVGGGAHAVCRAAVAGENIAHMMGVVRGKAHPCCGSGMGMHASHTAGIRRNL